MSVAEYRRSGFNSGKADRARRDGLRRTIFTPQALRSFKEKYRGEWRKDRKSGKGASLSSLPQKGPRWTFTRGESAATFALEMSLDCHRFANSRDGWLYEGDWYNDQRHGYGILSRQCENGDFRKCYAGYWLNGKRHGFGSRWYEDGSYYEGSFAQNLRNGQGRAWFADCSHYQGTWKNDSFDGWGLLVEADGNRYHGEFLGGLRQGYGKYYLLKTGQVHEGLWNTDACTSGVIRDTYWRQSAPRPTQYPIPRLTADTSPSFASFLA